MLLGSYRSATAQSACETGKVIASDGAAADEFGLAVAIDGDRAIVGSTLHECAAGLNCGAAYIYHRVGGAWTEEARLRASDAGAGDEFGGAVSLCGDWAAVGAYRDDDRGGDAGAVYLFRKIGDTWHEHQKVFGSDTSVGDWFGSALHLRGDRLIVGVRLDDVGAANTGAAFFFRWDGTDWVQEQKVWADDPTALAQFGCSVQLDEDRAVLGAQGDGHAGSFAGSAYVFRRVAGVWMQEGKLTASDAASMDWFGIAVAISVDWVLVGARYDDDRGSNSGSAYMYQLGPSGWVQRQKLLALDGGAVDRFGESAALSGRTAVFGAPGDDDRGSGAGAAYVFRYDGAQWNQAQKITASDAAVDDRLGISVAFDGTTALSGAFRQGDNGDDAGAAYFFYVPDLTIDLPDFAEFQNCFGHAALLETPCCERFDLSPDGQINAADFPWFQQQMTGP